MQWCSLVANTRANHLLESGVDFSNLHAVEGHLNCTSVPINLGHPNPQAKIVMEPSEGTSEPLGIMIFLH